MVDFFFLTSQSIIDFSISVPIRNRMIPTIPPWFVTKYCERGSKFLGTLAPDRQTRLVSALSVISNVQSKLTGKQWLDNFNRDGVLFGNGSFRQLPSFCTT